MSKERNNTSFYFSKIGGILILLGSLLAFINIPSFYGYGGYMGSMMNYMMGGYGMMSGFGMMGGFYYLPVVGIVSGLVVLYGAYMLSGKPKENSTWGSLILIFSVVGLASGGGFLIGSLLGIVGGLLALSKK